MNNEAAPAPEDMSNDQLYENLSKEIEELRQAGKMALDKLLQLKVDISTMMVEIATCYDLSVLSDCSSNPALEEEVLKDLRDADNDLDTPTKE